MKPTALCCLKHDWFKLCGLRETLFGSFSYYPPRPGLFLSVWTKFLERGEGFQHHSRSEPLKNCVSIFFTRLSHCHGPLYYMYTNRCLLTRILGLPGWNIFKTWAHHSIYPTHTTITLPRWHILKTLCLRASSGGTYISCLITLAHHSKHSIHVSVRNMCWDATWGIGNVERDTERETEESKSESKCLCLS